MNVYLIEDAGGVTLYDAGIRGMTEAVADAAAGLGGIARVLLGHADADHRGAAASLGAPLDTEHARASIRKLAEHVPAVVWPGHANPLRGDVRAQFAKLAAG